MRVRPEETRSCTVSGGICRSCSVRDARSLKTGTKSEARRHNSSLITDVPSTDDDTALLPPSLWLRPPERWRLIQCYYGPVRTASSSRCTTQLSSRYAVAADRRMAAHYGWTPRKKCDRNAYPSVLDGETLRDSHVRARGRAELDSVCAGTAQGRWAFQAPVETRTAPIARIPE